jgi:hypothetical protein
LHINVLLLIRQLPHGFFGTGLCVAIFTHSRKLLTTEDKTAPLSQTASVDVSIGDRMMKERAECTLALFNS